MTDNAGLRAVISKAQVIDELESTLPGWVKRHHVMYPAYVHVLKARASLRCEGRVRVGSGGGPEHPLTGAGRAGVRCRRRDVQPGSPARCRARVRRRPAPASHQAQPGARPQRELTPCPRLTDSLSQERPGGDYEISSDSLWALRGETLVRPGPPTGALRRRASTCMARRALPRRRMAAPAPLPRLSAPPGRRCQGSPCRAPAML